MSEEERKNYFLTSGKVAILIDGGFFLKRLNRFCKPAERNNIDYIEKMFLGNE